MGWPHAGSRWRASTPAPRGTADAILAAGRRRRSDLTAAAFALVIAVAELSPAIPHDPAPQIDWWITAIATTLTAASVSLLLRTGRWRGIRYLPLLLFLMAVQMLRAADGNGVAGFSPLLILPVLWYALYGTRTGVWLALAGVAAVQFAPLIMVGAPQYPVTLWRAGLLWVVILALVGLVAQDLVAAFRSKSAALALSEAQFRTAFSDAPIGVALIGATGATHGVFLRVNRALAALLGRDEEDLVNRSVLELTHPDDRTLTHQHLLAPPERQVAQTIHKRYLHSSGRAIPVKITYSRIDAGLGSDPYVVAHVEDTSTRPVADREQQNTLEHPSQFAAAVGHIGDGRGELAGVIRDELVAPLARIGENLNQLSASIAAALTPAQRVLLHTVQQDTAHLVAATTTLCNCTSTQEWAAAGGDARVDIDAIVRAAVDAIRPLARGRDLALQVDLDLAGGTVRGEADELERVVTSLLDNAVKFTPPGGAIDVQARVRADTMILDVTDTGIGIDPDEQDRIFDRFYRARTAAHAAIPGDGLGLTLVKAITEHHHGALRVHSEPGTGSTFTLTLPLCQNRSPS